MEAHTLRGLQKKRTTNFREDETKLLIQLWGSPQIQNKLYLTHRKEPVMRLLAANMQQRGFYRTPDEIKTRIRNLKCLYHRIKRTVQSGSGIGTVDPDWPHYKAMDAILSKQQNQKKDLYKENVLEGPRCEDIKQEIEDIDINDDMESYTTNSMGGSEHEDEPMNLPPLTPAPKDTRKQEKLKQLPKILPNISIPIQNQISTTTTTQTGSSKQGTIPSLPFPLLILNGVQQQQQQQQQQPQLQQLCGNDKKDAQRYPNIDQNPDMNQILRELLDVQKENLTIEKQRLELEKQRLEFERFIGSQLLAMGPFFSNLLQRLASQNSETTASENNIDSCDNDDDNKTKQQEKIKLFKDSKILRNLLNEGIKKYMNNNDDSENDDSTINDENSNTENK